MRKFTSVVVAFATVFLLFTPTSFAGGGQGVGDQVVDIAYKYSDAPYVYGGTTPSGFDCSGYTQYVFSKVGIDLNRTSRSQYHQGHSVSRSNLQPGDLLFFNYSDGGSISHVGIYIGNNKMISAENPRDDVTVASIAPNRYWGGRLVGAKRVIPDQVETEAADPELPTGQYHDVPSGHWAASYIEKMSKDSIINGYQGDVFKPDNNVTRGQVAKMMSVALGLNTTNNNQFNDIAGHWSAKYVNAMANKGYLTGYDDGSFKPEQAMSRQEIAVVFERAFNLSGSGANFKDVPSDHWSADEIEAMAANDITTGYGDNTFRPTNNTKRSEFSAFLYRALY
ncbi:C40 family peptidase [Halobacillus salinus]|uniref:C40 family peptidase n=1 Tax=Halobacillus salinus TaxID=192814 RepID=UPI0009A7546A|nr:C40 family peptidase [Halobacillus salinus]